MWNFVNFCELLWNFVKFVKFVKFGEIWWNLVKFVKFCEFLWIFVKFCEICEILWNLRNFAKFCEILWNFVKFCEIIRGRSPEASFKLNFVYPKMITFQLKLIRKRVFRTFLSTLEDPTHNAHHILVPSSFTRPSYGLTYCY